MKRVTDLTTELIAGVGLFIYRATLVIRDPGTETEESYQASGSHSSNPIEAEQLAKHVAIIRKGEIIANGTMTEILAMHDPLKTPDGYKGGKLEEVFINLTSEK